MFVMATTIAVGVAMFGLLSLIAVLISLWKVYKRGGRTDRALREARLRPVLLPHASARGASSPAKPPGTG
jgi:hypothetical protein